ncbi:MAG TPA: YxeA family protein [Epulopiscium sp.]|nr:YxeA family protein [Candidatus Epulonipiscium sp.]
MRKIFIVPAILMLGVILLFTYCDININKIGKDNVYIEIIEPTGTEEDRLDNGEVITRYIYNQRAFDKEGKSVEIEFSAGKKLRKGAYLMLYIKDGNVVTSYDEVKWSEIPSNAQIELEYYNIGN